MIARAVLAAFFLTCVFTATARSDEPVAGSAFSQLDELTDQANQKKKEPKQQPHKPASLVDDKAPPKDLNKDAAVLQGIPELMKDNTQTSRLE